jgi:hypothetical protein
MSRKIFRPIADKARSQTCCARSSASTVASCGILGASRMLLVQVIPNMCGTFPHIMRQTSNTANPSPAMGRGLLMSEKTLNRQRPGVGLSRLRAFRFVDRFLVWLAMPAMAREQLRRRGLRKVCDCDLAGCEAEAVHHVRWGKNTMQAGNMCEKHLRETWESCQSQVAAGLCFWIQGVPE